MPAGATDALAPDPWLGAQLGCPAYRVGETGDPHAVRALQPPCFAYGKVHVDHLDRVHRFESAGFRLTDTNVTFEKACVPHDTPPSDHGFGAPVRDARTDDEDAVAAIAGTAFRWTRFHRDPAVSNACADAIKAAWVRSFFHGQRGDACLVAEYDGGIAGFLLALVTAEVVTTDLIAVAPQVQRRGIAQALMRALERRHPNARVFRVGTQLANLPSLGLYERLGYRVAGATYVFHLHRTTV